MAVPMTGPLLARHRRCQDHAPAARARTVLRLFVHGHRHPSVGEGTHRVRRDAPVHRLGLHGYRADSASASWRLPQEKAEACPKLLANGENPILPTVRRLVGYDNAPVMPTLLRSGAGADRGHRWRDV